MWRSSIVPPPKKEGKKKEKKDVLIPHTPITSGIPCLPQTVSTLTGGRICLPCILLVTFRHEVVHWLTLTSTGIFCLGLQLACAISSRGIRHSSHILNMACFCILISGVLLSAPFRKVGGYVWRKNNVRSRHRLVGFVERSSRGGTERIDAGYCESMCWTGASSVFAQQRYAYGVCLSPGTQEKFGTLGILQRPDRFSPRFTN